MGNVVRSLQGPGLGKSVQDWSFLSLRESKHYCLKVLKNIVCNTVVKEVKKYCL